MPRQSIASAVKEPGQQSAPAPVIGWKRRAVGVALATMSVGALTGLFNPGLQRVAREANTPRSQRKAASAAGDKVCPLSDADANAAVGAFGKLTPLFNQEPRCVNCHGALNVTNEKAPTTHPGEVATPAQLDSMQSGGPSNPCLECHGAAKEWTLPPNSMMFAGKDSRTLCHQMKKFEGSNGLAAHLDHDATGFVDIGFAGTRGLDEAGQNLATGPVPDPPKNFTKSQAVDLAKIWDNAATREDTRDIPDCGCTPLHYALRVQYLGARINVGILTMTAWQQTAPVDIPITFVDTLGNLQGHASATMIETGTAASCQIDGKQSADLTLMNASVKGGTLHTQISGPPSQGTLNMSCQTYVGSDGGSRKGPKMSNASPFNGSPPLFTVALSAVVGADTTITEQTPAGESKLHVTIVEQK